MDISLVTGAVAAIKAARDLGSAAMDLRDFNKFAGAIAQINEQLLKAQESLFAHNADMMELQQKYHEVCEELRKLQKTAAEHDKYSLHEITPRVFVYRAKASSGTGAKDAEPMHYLCQPCFDKGIKSVLQNHEQWGSVYLRCTICDADYDSGIRKPYNLP